MEKFKILSRIEMKNVAGGKNPNCDGLEGDYDWTCCEATQDSHIGVMTCDQASEYCNGGTLTVDSPEDCGNGPQ